MSEAHQRNYPYRYLQKATSSMMSLLHFDKNFLPQTVDSSDGLELRKVVKTGKYPVLDDYSVDAEIQCDSNSLTRNWRMDFKKTTNWFLLLGFITFGFILGFIVTIFQDKLHVKNVNILQPIIGTNTRRFTIDDVLDGKFGYKDSFFRFIRPPTLWMHQDLDSGLYFTVDDSGGNKKFVAKQLVDKHYYKDLGMTIFSYENIKYNIFEIDVNFYLNRAIFVTNLEVEFRHSSKAYYWLKDFDTDTIIPITPFSQGTDLVKLSYAKFSPAYNFVYFVYENDLYIQNVHHGFVQRITNDGSVDIFNGKTDWVYEEEIMNQDSAVWWSPDDSIFIFAKIDNSLVKSYDLQTYINNQQYPTSKLIKYPKPGTYNPVVTLYMYNIKQGVLYAINKENDKDLILYDCMWLNKTVFLFKETDRTSQIMYVKAYDLIKNTLDIIRTVNASDYNGWIDKPKKMLIIPPNKDIGRHEYGYIDVQSDFDGYFHLFYFSNYRDNKGHQLTKGEWEITGIGPLGFEYDNDIVYFMANKIGNMAQNLYSVPLSNMNAQEIHTLQNPNMRNSYYEFVLSSSCRFGIKKYLGPEIPITNVGPLTSLIHDQVSQGEVMRLTDTRVIESSMKSYDIPRTSYKTMVLDDGVMVDYVEILPFNMSMNAKYPLLISVYGAPSSRTFTTKFNILLEESIASSLDTIILKIEPRGTGGKGWPFRKWVKGKLGYWEPRDICEVTQKFIASYKNVIDQKKIAIWGWSYGGFTTLKTLEYDQGNIFKYGIAVAPVTDWRLYDSFYTERYMGSLLDNKKGYEDISRINNFEPFKKIDRLLIMHGTADDNVHIQNSFQLLDAFDLHNVKNYDLHIFIDSNHNIQFHNAQTVIYQKIFHWLKNIYTR